MPVQRLAQRELPVRIIQAAVAVVVQEVVVLVVKAAPVS
jgi:hypothetical protein